MEDASYVVGGGAVETELSMKIRDYAASVGGRVQLAIEAYAASFEVIPLTLAENSGFNQIDKLVDLKNAHSKGNKNFGLNVYNGKVIDMLKEGVIEPSRSKRQSIQSRQNRHHAHPRRRHDDHPEQAWDARDVRPGRIPFQ